MGWYADGDSLTKEIAEIQLAISNGIPSYELKYSVKTQKNG